MSNLVHTRELELDPQSASAPHLFLAQIAIIQNRKEEVERYINDYLKLHPNSPQVPKLKEVLARGGPFVSVLSLDPNADPRSK